MVWCRPCAGSCGQWRGSQHLLLWLSMQWVGGRVCIHGPFRALKVLKSLEFDWTKFKALKALNFTK